MAEKIMTYSGTTTASDEDIMTVLKTQTTLASDTDDIPFTLMNFKLQSATSTEVKINNEDNYSPLIEDLVDGLYKIDTFGWKVNTSSLIVKDSGIAYTIKFTY